MDVEGEIGRGELWLVRHGETQWSKSGRHTGMTDLPVTEEGQRQAELLRERLKGRSFELVLSSPLSRARETCRIAGFGDAAEVDDDLHEWDYGDYEGLTTSEIRQKVPGWTIWAGDPPNGETLEQVAGRARKIISRARGIGGDVALFSHGHFLRVLCACWLGLPPDAGRLFALGTASISILGLEHNSPVISRWNEPCFVPGEKT
jgi:broad specificity phosphatase PhoE